MCGVFAPASGGPTAGPGDTKGLLSLITPSSSAARRWSSPPLLLLFPVSWEPWGQWIGRVSASCATPALSIRGTVRRASTFISDRLPGRLSVVETVALFDLLNVPFRFCLVTLWLNIRE